MARAVVVYLAVVLAASALGALVAQLVWGQWFYGALVAGCLAAWAALPAGMGSGWPPPSQRFGDPPPPPNPREPDRD